MRSRVRWLAGAAALAAGAGVAAAQTGSTGAPPGAGAITKSNKTLSASGGAKAGTDGLSLTTPIPKAGGAKSGSAGGWAGKTTGTGTAFGSGGTGGMTGAGGFGGANGFGGGFGFGGMSNRAQLTPEQEITLLAEARLLVTQLEGTGNLTLDRRESMLLTLLVYEALRQQAVHSGVGAGGTTTPTTPATPTTGP